MQIDNDISKLPHLFMKSDWNLTNLSLAFKKIELVTKAVYVLFQQLDFKHNCSFFVTF